MAHTVQLTGATSAISRYEEALKINPKFSPAADNLAWLMMAQGGNSDAALSYAQTAREQLLQDPNVADTLGWIYFHKGIYLKSLALNPIFNML